MESRKFEASIGDAAALKRAPELRNEIVTIFSLGFIWDMLYEWFLALG